MFDEKSYLQGKLDAYNEKLNADGCIGCAFVELNEWEMPCAKCKRNAKDYWRSNELASKNKENSAK